MKDYQKYEIEDLVKDPYFKKSVLAPDDQSARFWSEWAAMSPGNREKYEQARLMVITFQEVYEETVSDDEVRRRLGQVGDMKNEGRKQRMITWPARWRWGVAAAMVTVAVSITWWNTREQDTLREDLVEVVPEKRPESVEKSLSESYSGEIVRQNNTGSNLTLMLGDSSVVTLLPGSELKFPSIFSRENRKVLLTGDAFFEVTSNPGRPFLVYAGETVVKVLGTSFRVTAFDKDDRVTVKVLSGRVSVYRVSDFAANPKAGKGLLLIPNEEAIVQLNAQTAGKFKKVKRVVSEEARELQYKELIFDDTPISDIFLELERTYGMEIEFDQERFRKCPITTYFKEESLLERINTICQAVGATYLPDNGKIIVSGIDCTGL